MKPRKPFQTLRQMRGEKLGQNALNRKTDVKGHQTKKLGAKCWRIFEFLAICAALWGLYETVEGNRLNRVALQETIKGNEANLKALEETIEGNRLSRESLTQAKIVSAWSILTAKAPGNSGKIAALETLHQAGEPLRGIDLSCKVMGGMVEGKCVNGTYLASIKLPKANLHTAHLEGANLRFAHLEGAHLQFAHLEGADLLKAHLEGAHLRDAHLNTTELWGAHLKGADLQFAHLEGAHLQFAHLEGANLSSTKFCDAEQGCAKNFSQKQINKAWAWADRLPIFEAGKHKLDLTLPKNRLFDPNLREEYQALNGSRAPTKENMQRLREKAKRKKAK